MTTALAGALWWLLAVLSVPAAVGLVLTRSKVLRAVAVAASRTDACSLATTLGANRLTAASSSPSLRAAALTNSLVAGAVSRAIHWALLQVAAASEPTIAALARVGRNTLSTVVAVAVANSGAAVLSSPALVALTHIGAGALSVSAASARHASANWRLAGLASPALSAAAEVGGHAGSVLLTTLATDRLGAGISLPAIEAAAFVGVLGREVQHLVRTRHATLVAVGKGSLKSGLLNGDLDSLVLLESISRNLSAWGLECLLSRNLNHGQERRFVNQWVVGVHLDKRGLFLRLERINIVISLLSKVNGRVLISSE